MINSIKNKLLLYTIIIIASFVIVGILNFYRQNNYKKQLDIVVGKQYNLQKKSQETKLLIKSILLDVLDKNRKVNIKSKNKGSALDRKAIKFYLNIDTIMEYIDYDNTNLEAVREVFQEFYILSKRISKYILLNTIDNHQDTLKLFIKLEKRLQTLFDNVSSFYEKEFESSLLIMRTKAKNNAYISTLLIIYGILFSILIFFILIKSITQPIKNLIGAIKEFNKTGKGKAKVYRNDELGMIAKAFNELSDNLRWTIEGLKREVKEREKINEAMVQTKKMQSVGELAAGIAHDFNNILSAIIGTISIIKLKRIKNQLNYEELDDYLGDISDSSERAVNLVRQLMTLSKRQKLSLQNINLNEVLINVKKICNVSFDKSIEIKVSYSKSKPLVRADSTQIEQVLLNLSINASHALTLMRKKGDKWGGEIELGIRSFIANREFCAQNEGVNENDEYWEVFVKDNGVGMKEELKYKIFDPFFTTKSDKEGNGLGLSMVYGIIKQHKGYINLISKEGVGTTFFLYLPKIMEQEEEKNIDTVVEKRYEFTGYALIVDDESILRKVAGAILSEMGFKVITARDGEEGIRLFKERSKEWKIIILDLMMPKKTGDEVFYEIQKYDKEVKVLITSGLKKDKRLKKLQEHANVNYLEKPYSFEKLADAVVNILNS